MKKTRCLSCIWLAIAILATASLIGFYSSNSKCRDQLKTAESINLFSDKSGDYRKINILPAEKSNNVSFMWVLGPVAGVKFYSRISEKRQLLLELSCPFPQQHLKIYFNGKVVDSYYNTTNQKWLEQFYVLDCTVDVNKGFNEIVLEFDAFNGNSPYSNSDLRPLASALTRLRLTKINI